MEELNSNFASFKNRDVTIAGIIIAMRQGKTKKGNDFGILTIEDFSGTYELPFFGEDYIKFRNYFILETAIYIKGKVQTKKWNNELAFNVISMDLLSVIGENLIRSITLQVDIENLTHEIVTEIHNQLVNEAGDIPLNFILYDREGHRVKMFSRSCKIKRSRELYEYFENNDVIKMKID